MATRTIQRVTRYGTGSNVMKYGEASGQSFKQGELVYLVSGLVTVVAADGQSILGIAQNDASGTAATACYVDVLKSTDWILINAYHATAASAVMTDANVGTVAAGVDTSSNKTVADINAGSNKTFKIIARIPEDSATDIYPRCIACILDTYAQSNHTA